MSKRKEEINSSIMLDKIILEKKLNELAYGTLDYESKDRLFNESMILLNEILLYTKEL